MSARIKYALVIAVFIAGIILGVLDVWKSLEIGRILGLPVVIAGVVLAGLLFRCPHCGQRMGMKFRPGKPCPHCGQIIE